MKQFRTFLTLAVMAVVASGLLLAQPNPFVGTWKLNLAKSTYSGTTAPKSLTRTVEAKGAGVKSSSDGVAADGKHIAYSYTASYDGKDNPISGSGAPNGADSIAVKRIDSNTTEGTLKKAGKVVATTKTVISTDGKVSTITSKGTGPDGKPTSTTTVWDKQ